MTNFEYSLPFVLQQEGEWCNVPGDRGGETYRGIARKKWPMWFGWATIDHAKLNMVKQPEYGSDAYKEWVKYLNRILAENPLLQKYVASFYKINFWHIIWDTFDRRLAAKVMNISVHSGMLWGIKLLQRACGVEDDGHIGKKTLSAINNMSTDELLKALTKVQAKYYADIIADDPDQKKFAKNWESRAKWIPVA